MHCIAFGNNWNMHLLYSLPRRKWTLCEVDVLQGIVHFVFFRHLQRSEVKNCLDCTSPKSSSERLASCAYVSTCNFTQWPHKFQGAKMLNPSTVAVLFYLLVCTVFTKNKGERKRTKRSCEPKREPSTSLSLSNSGSFVSESCIDQSQIADINSLIKEISWWLAAGSNGRSDSPHIADLICLWCVASGGIGIGFHRM